MRLTSLWMIISIFTFVEGTGAATVLDLPLDETKKLASLTVRTLANEVVIGLISAVLVSDE